MQPYPYHLVFEDPESPFSVEFVKRTGHFTMQTNHTHSYFEMYYLISGERSYFIKDQSFTIRKGDLVLIDCYEIHKTIDLGVPDHERIVMHFDKAFACLHLGKEAELLLQTFSGCRPVYRFDAQRRREADRLVAKLLTELYDRQPGFAAAMKHAVFELLLLAARTALEQGERAEESDVPVPSKITDIVRYVNAHYAEPLSLPMLAERFYISPFHLSRTFKEMTGFPLTVYLNLLRVREAQRLLRDTGMKVIDISAAVGYDNFSHFGKTFKRIAGITPRAYRSRPFDSR